MNNMLEHSGILGMKWGQRRYQNKDGSLTEEGRKRYSKDGSAVREKSVKDMSDEEIRASIARLTLEKDYNNLQPKTESGNNYAKKFANKLIDSSMNAAADVGAQFLKTLMVDLGNKALNTLLETKDEKYVYTNNNKKK